MATVHLGDRLAIEGLQNRIAAAEAAELGAKQKLRTAIELIERAVRENVLSNGLTNDMARFRARAPR